MGWDFDRARSKGIDVGHVVSSWAHHLVKDRQKLRDNPRSLDANKPPEYYALAVTEHRTASGVRWRTLGQLPHDIEELTVAGSSMDAARNKQSLRSLMEQRYRVEFASALQRAGLYGTDLEGRRAAMRVALASQVTVVDLSEAMRA